MPKPEASEQATPATPAEGATATIVELPAAKPAKGAAPGTPCKPAAADTAKPAKGAKPRAENTEARTRQVKRTTPRRPNLDASKYYLNRELTWLEFNKRVLHEAEDERTPLLERVKFLAIVSANLDEFFMKRIGGLKQQVGAGVHDLTVDGRTPQQQIDECYRVVDTLRERKEALLPRLMTALREHEIHLVSYADLDEDDQQRLRDYYVENIFPLVTPQAVDPAHPFPFISNLSLNLLVTLGYTRDEEPVRARVKVPVGSGIPRLLRIGKAHRYVPLEQVMSHNLDLLFPKMEIQTCELFQVTRNANTEHAEEHADDLLEMIESEIRDRKFAHIVRMVVEKDMVPFHRGMLAAELGLNESDDVFETTGMMAMRDLMELATLEFPQLHDPVHHPYDHPRLDSSKLFYMIRDAGAILLQHPYESFTTSVERFLKEASRDAKVRAIKMILYRTSAGSKVIDYLIDAARNGKQVAVVVELKARFDEAANIRWASRLEHAGIHVTYGVVGLKTHCKAILVVRQDYAGLRLYAHVGTGNYHAGTARMYADLGMLTADPVIGRDLIELFNYLTTGYTPKRGYQKILPAPKVLKRALIAKIEREAALHSESEPGLIQFKTNALEDADITRALYEASRAGVKVDLIVRDTCRLRPGIPGVSENIRVISVVGRFLEHSRIYYFRNGGAEEYYIGSADAMRRNLEHRVEILVPVEPEALRTDLRRLLDVLLGDQRCAWDMQPDGSYVQRVPEDDKTPNCCHELLTRDAEQRHKASTRLKRRKPQVLGRRNVPLVPPK